MNQILGSLFFFSLTVFALSSCGDGEFEIDRDAGVSTNIITIGQNAILLPTNLDLDP